MRGKDEQQLDVFSYISPEQRVPQDHPLRSLRAMTDEALRGLQPRFNKLYAKTGCPWERATNVHSSARHLQTNAGLCHPRRAYSMQILSPRQISQPSCEP